jgi:hypothetical protein
MIESFWDLYVAYINHSVEYNKKHDIDPHHYEMEWNHFLPQCLFGDLPFGQYLMLKQHAIASALQTLAFRKVCVCPWHVKHLPTELWSLCKPLYVARQSLIGQQHVASGHWEKCVSLGGKACYEKHPDRIKELGRVQGKINVDDGTLKRAREAMVESTRKPVEAIKFGQSLKFPSIAEASRQLKIPSGNINRCLKGTRKTAGGYSWSYVPRGEKG